MNKFSIIRIAVSMSLLLSGCTPSISADTARLSDDDSSIIGIDISSNQGSVDFAKIKAAGISYVFIRATDGITYQDSDFESNFGSAQAAGLVVGAYHFYETEDDPSAQLGNFTSVVTLRPGDLPPVVDIEKLHKQDDSNLTENLQVFLNGLESHYGVKPIIYSGLYFANEYMPGFGDYPLWLAEYKVSSPTLPKGWSDWTFWQWSQTSTVDGITGDVDADRFNGNEASFRNTLIK